GKRSWRCENRMVAPYSFLAKRCMPAGIWARSRRRWPADERQRRRFWPPDDRRIRNIARVLVFGEAHLRQILSAYATYYNEIRTHLTLGKASPPRGRLRRAQQAAKVPRIGYLSPGSASPPDHWPTTTKSSEGCASLSMSRDETSSLSTDLRTASLIGWLH